MHIILMEHFAHLYRVCSDEFLGSCWGINKLFTDFPPFSIFPLHPTKELQTHKTVDDVVL